MSDQKKPRKPRKKKEAKPAEEQKAPELDNSASSLDPEIGLAEEQVSESAEVLAEAIDAMLLAESPVASEIEPTVVAEPAQKRQFSTPNPDDEVLSVEDAAGSMVDGFKESWLPAIKAKSKQMGLGDKASRREWRSMFIAWGGQSILK